MHNNGDIYAHSKQGDFNGRLNLDRKEIDVDLKLIAEDRKVEELSKNVGTKLYDALFDKEISRSFASAMATCDNQKECGVRLRLTFEDPEIAAIPWEFLFDKTINTFLANDPKIALSRYIEVPTKQDIEHASLPRKCFWLSPVPKTFRFWTLRGKKNLLKKLLRNTFALGRLRLMY